MGLGLRDPCRASRSAPLSRGPGRAVDHERAPVAARPPLREDSGSTGPRAAAARTPTRTRPIRTATTGRRSPGRRRRTTRAARQVAADAVVPLHPTSGSTPSQPSVSIMSAGTSGSPRLHRAPLAGSSALVGTTVVPLLAPPTGSPVLLVAGPGTARIRASVLVAGAGAPRAPESVLLAPRPGRSTRAAPASPAGRWRRSSALGAALVVGRKCSPAAPLALRRVALASTAASPSRAAEQRVRPSACSSAARSEISEVDIAFTLRPGDRVCPPPRRRAPRAPQHHAPGPGERFRARRPAPVHQSSSRSERTSRSRGAGLPRAIAGSVHPTVRRAEPAPGVRRGVGSSNSVPARNGGARNGCAPRSSSASAARP